MIEKIDDGFLARKYVSLQGNAGKRGVEFTLSLKRLKKVLETKKCFFTGVPLNRINEDPNQLSIDRIDNSKGYVDDNIVACARDFNQRVKGELTINEVEQLYKGLKKAGLV